MRKNIRVFKKNSILELIETPVMHNVCQVAN